MAIRVSTRDFKKLTSRNNKVEVKTEPTNEPNKKPEELPIKMVWNFSFGFPEKKGDLVRYYYKELLKAWFS